MALNRSDKSRILRRYFPGMTRNSEMSTEPNPDRFQFKLTALINSLNKHFGRFPPLKGKNHRC